MGNRRNAWHCVFHGSDYAAHRVRRSSPDFVPRMLPPTDCERSLLHATYTVFDGIQVILGILVTLWLVRGNEQT